MSSSNSIDFTVPFRWEIIGFQEKWTNAHFEKKDMSSDDFSLATHPTIQFCLQFNAINKEWTKNWHGIQVKNFGGYQSIKLDYNVWFENEGGDKFCERLMSKDLFNEVDKSWGWIGLNKNKLDLFKKVYDENETIFMCCEIVSLEKIDGSGPEFISNQWKLYEEGVHDAKIFVGEERKEFKILKTFFMAQSSVFKEIFLSKNSNNEVTIKDMNEETMLSLIKWLYAAKFDDKGQIEELFKAAEKYKIDALKSRCLDQMIQTLDVTNVLSRLALSKFYSQSDLELKAVSFVGNLEREELAVCLLSQKWLDFVVSKPTEAAEISKVVLEKLNPSI